MKIINEKGKLFGLINIVDLLVLIAAVAVAAGVGYKLFAPQIKESVQPQVELTAIVRVRGATPFLVTEVERNSQVGKQLVSGNSYVNGTIEDMKIEDYAQQVTTADGRIVTAVDPDKKDIVFTIKTTVPRAPLPVHRYAGGSRRPHLHRKDQRLRDERQHRLGRYRGLSR